MSEPITKRGYNETKKAQTLAFVTTVTLQKNDWVELVDPENKQDNRVRLWSSGEKIGFYKGPKAAAAGDVVDIQVIGFESRDYGGEGGGGGVELPIEMSDVTGLEDALADLEGPYAIADVTGLQAALDAKVASSTKGQANGVASLDGSGKIPLAQIPDSVLGQVEYQGTWNASTNSPALTNPDSTAHGKYYIVNADGTQFSQDFKVGDWIINNSGQWQKVDNTDAVASFNGRTGAIVPVSGDYAVADITGLQTALDGKADVTHTHAIADVTGLQAALDSKAPLASPTFTGTVSGITKAMVGLANVDNTADASKAFAASQITSGVFAVARLGTGTPDGTKFLRDDGTFATPSGGSSLTSTQIGYGNGSNALTGSAEFVYDATNKVIRHNGGNTIGSKIQFIQGTVTGTASTDGTIIGLTDGDAGFVIDNLESSSSISIKIGGSTRWEGNSTETKMFSPNFSKQVQLQNTAVRIYHSAPGDTYFTSTGIGIEVASPTAKLHIDGAAATAFPNMLQFTHNTTTGVTATDGFIMGFPSSSSANFMLKQQEGAKLTFAVGSQNILEYDSSGNNLFVGFSSSQFIQMGSGGGGWIQIQQGSARQYMAGTGTALSSNAAGGYLFSATAVVHIGAGAAGANLAPLKYTSGTIQTTAEAGTHEYNGTHFETKSNGVRYALGGTLAQNFADVGNVGTGEDDLFSYTTPANTFDVNGQSIRAKYSGTFANTASTKQLKAYFGGTAFFDSTALTISAASYWTLDVHLIRVSSSVVRCSATFTAVGTSGNTLASYTEVTGLTLTGTNVLKITGTSAGGSEADNDIVAKMAVVEFKGSV